MKTPDQYNKEFLEKFEIQKRENAGICCPHCEPQKEMLETNPGTLLLSNPPKKQIYCPECRYNTYIYA